MAPGVHDGTAEGRDDAQDVSWSPSGSMLTMLLWPLGAASSSNMPWLSCTHALQTPLLPHRHALHLASMQASTLTATAKRTCGTSTLLAHPARCTTTTSTALHTLPHTGPDCALTPAFTLW